MKLEAVAIKMSKGVGVRMGSGDGGYINFYLGGRWCADAKVEVRDGKFLLIVFHPTATASRYAELELVPKGEEEFLFCRHEEFEFFDFDWRQ